MCLHQGCGEEKHVGRRAVVHTGAVGHQRPITGTTLKRAVNLGTVSVPDVVPTDRDRGTIPCPSVTTGIAVTCLLHDKEKGETGTA